MATSLTQQQLLPSNSLLATNHLLATNQTNMTGNSTSDPPVTLSVDNLYPAIIQCFAIMMAGYIAGRANLISQAQGKGIGVFVGKFCLPALLFRNMVTLNFDQVNWYFLLGIAISKSAVFVAVAGLTLLIKRPLHLGFAGLFAIFATQSNDFALGYPILKALYGDSHPEYLQYIYLIAPISLVMLNPIGFTMLEVHRHKRDIPQPHGTCGVVLHVIKDVLSNPIVFMVLIGIGGNFVFNQKVPAVLDDILSVLGNAYSASALFYLGLSLVGKVQGQLGVKLILPLLLIGAKTLLLPLITWQVVGALEMNMPVNISRSLSMYGFLYGTFPTAPSVFLYASQFAVAQEVVATGMVVCTFLSAPLMFVSAKMMTVVVNSEMDYKSLLLDTSFDLSVISLACNIWVLVVLLLSRKHKKMPHQFLICLVLAQSMGCVGMIVYDGLESTLLWQHYLQFSILLVGVFSTRCFAAVLSVVLYLLHCKSLCFVLRVKFWLYFFGLGFPMLSTGMLLMLGNHHMHNEIDPSFHYGSDQAAASLVVLGICSIVNITFLVMRLRNSRLHINKKSGLKVKSKVKVAGNHHQGEGHYNSVTIDEDEEARLLPGSAGPSSPKILDSAEACTGGSVTGSADRSRSNSSSKLLGGGEEATTDNNRYRSLSCANCTDNCEVELYREQQPPVRTKRTSSSIEDIVQFPDNMQRNKTRSKQNKYTNASAANSITKINTEIKNHSPTMGCINKASRSESSSSTTSEDSFVDTIHDYACQTGNCNYQQRRRCAGLLRCYHASAHALQVPESSEQAPVVRMKRMALKDEYQTDRFLILLLLLQISMFMGLFLCTWRLFNNSKSGIYVEIEFLDGFFNYGQSLVVFAIFGFDTKLMIMPCIRRWRKLIYGVEHLHIPPRLELSDDDKHICDQFIRYHRENCEEKIVRDMKYRLRTYNGVFCGSSLCDWLIEVGLCRDRSEAITYGRTLLQGQVISHVTSEHDFHDMPYFYRFLDDDETD